MKSFFTSIVAILALAMTSCSSSMSDDTFVPSAPVSQIETISNLYGGEIVRSNTANNIPSVITNEMRDVLEALRQNSNAQNNCVRVTENNREKVVMTASYRTPITRANAEGGNFELKVSLNFSINNGQLYHWGTDYDYSSELFDWKKGSFSMSPVMNGEGFTYQFESETYIYFKVSDEANQVVKIPVIFKGTYNFDTEEGTYSFQLLKYSK